MIQNPFFATERVGWVPGRKFPRANRLAANFYLYMGVMNETRKWLKLPYDRDRGLNAAKNILQRPNWSIDGVYWFP
jgi:hypothetical protein